MSRSRATRAIRTTTGSTGSPERRPSRRADSALERGLSHVRQRSGMTPEGLSRRERLADLLGQPDEKSFGPPDVAEPIHVFVLDHFADELRAALAEPGERIVDVLHGEHDA